MANEYPPGARALDSTERFLRRFIYLPSDHHYRMVTLWIAGTHFTNSEGAPVHSAYGRLGFVSDQPGSGKSFSTERVLALVPKSELLVQPSLRGIVDAVEEHNVIALEEADKYFSGKSQRHVIAFLNTGYRRSGAVLRHANKRVDAFCLAIYNGLNETVAVNPELRALRTRTLMVPMTIPPSNVELEEYDYEIHPGTEARLSEALASWATMVTRYVTKVSVEMPPNVTGRRKEIWQPLLRVSVLAGGPWPEYAYEACKAIETDSFSDALIATPEDRIMSDIALIADGRVRIPTADLLAGLCELPRAPWGSMWPNPESSAVARELAALVMPHGLLSGTYWFSVPGLPTKVQMKGYDLSSHSGCELCTVTDTPGADVTDDEDMTVTDDENADVTDDEDMTVTDGGRKDRIYQDFDPE
jgi:hypothetical protein